MRQIERGANWVASVVSPHDARMKHMKCRQHVAVHAGPCGEQPKVDRLRQLGRLNTVSPSVLLGVVGPGDNLVEQLAARHLLEDLHMQRRDNGCQHRAKKVARERSVPSSSIHGIVKGWVVMQPGKARVG